MRPTRLLVLALLLAALAAGPALGQGGVADQRREVQRLGRELARLDAEAGAAAAAHNAALDRLEGLRRRAAQTRRELSGARRDTARAQEVLADRLVSIYVEGSPTLAELVLGAGSLRGAADPAELLDQVAATDASAAAAVRERRDRLDALGRRLERQRDRADAEAAERRRQRERVDQLVGERRRVLAGAEAELRRRIRAENARRKAEALRRQAARAAAVSGGFSASAIVPPGLTSDGQVFPVAGPNRFSDDWLSPRPGGRVHQGIDIFAAEGTPLVAVADGSLYNVGYNGLGGWRLWLRDRAGTTYYYAHLTSFAPAAREGASVSRGTVVGYVGTSGDARGTSPHVHFEIHPGGGGPVRPFPIIAGWPRVG